VKAADLRMTESRQMVLQIIKESHTHLNAEEIWQRAHQRGMKTSLATIYRAVKLLEQAGLISEHSLGQDQSHYEAAGKNTHYHFTCIGCGNVLEFSTSQVQSVIEKLIKDQHIQIRNVHLLMEGTCRQCLEEKKYTDKAGK